jgi:hypothetical protein
MPSVEWYWHRLRAMSSADLTGHVRKKASQLADSWFPRDFNSVVPVPELRYPTLPHPGAAPDVVVNQMKADASRILGGRWKFFGNHEVQVDDPPKWQKDYLAQADLATTQAGFKLNHRQLPFGADIKCIWELSRWYDLARLAQASWVLREPRLSEKCLTWLEDWSERNPPFVGWNWTSALETGLRLIQFTWIDGWITTGPEFPSRVDRLQGLRQRLLAPHAFYTWRNRSFGSSANNHLIGELAGLIVACVRYPGLGRWCPSLTELCHLWERQVLAQFAKDGGNREHALNYHLFSLELSYHAHCALKAASIRPEPAVEERLSQAAEFFVNVQTELEPWDYGDSDNAFVVPLMTHEANAASEWCAWLAGKKSSALPYWLGDYRPAKKLARWKHFSESGYLTYRSHNWFLRLDMSALGFLNTAAHGHADVLHLSLWHMGEAIIIDPGTGAYYADSHVRNYLASRDAHNGPNSGIDFFPRRRGPFLWAGCHDKATLQKSGDGYRAELSVKNGLLSRSVSALPNEAGWHITDAFEPAAGQQGDFTVFWQFAPGSSLEALGERTIKLQRSGLSLLIEVSPDWREMDMVLEPGNEKRSLGTVSRFFRKHEFAPFLRLSGNGSSAGRFRTTFSAVGNA